MTISTYFALFAEFETAEIPLTDLCTKYFGLSEREAKQRANMQQLPIPFHRGGSQKSPWLCNIKDLASFIDELADAGRKEWEKSQVKVA